MFMSPMGAYRSQWLGSFHGNLPAGGVAAPAHAPGPAPLPIAASAGPAEEDAG
jgi:hypothetical protein